MAPKLHVINVEAARSPVDASDVTVAFDTSELPARILVSTFVPPFESVRYVPQRTCKRIIRTYDGITGICKCGLCERTIGSHDKFCKHCGAMLVGTDYARVE